MREPPTIQIDFMEHPAVRAWAAVESAHVLPEAIEILKHRRDSRVYRLLGVGPNGSNVVAKRSPMANALAERFVYHNVLPQLPFATLRHYGLLQEQDGEFCWAFIEDAGGVPYSPDVEEHCVLAAKWLGIMHTHGVGTPAASGLPDRGSSHYLNCLLSARERILHNLSNPALCDDDRVTLRAIVAQCDLVERYWRRVEECCAGAPQTFVHADLHESNVHVRMTLDGITLTPFDWESAGWAVPAIDLVLAGLDLGVYRSVVGKSWPGLGVEALQRLAFVGKVFQLLELIEWESKSLECAWLHKPMKHMRYYQPEISHAIRVAGLEH